MDGKPPEAHDIRLSIPPARRYQPGRGTSRTHTNRKWAAALITGATDGIGNAVAHRLAGLVDTLLIHGRCPNSLMELAASLAPANPGTTIIPIKADLASTAEIRYLVNRVCGLLDRLDIIVNNAATAGIYPRTLSSEGHEMTLQVNYLAPVMVTAGLFPLLTASEQSRIVNVVCCAQKNVKLRWHDLSLEQRYHPVTAYAQSKLALTLHTTGLADIMADSSCGAVCVDPGTADTKLHRRAFGWPAGPVAAAADCVLYAITAPTTTKGCYFERKQVIQPPAELLSPHVQQHLDRITASMLNIHLPWVDMVYSPLTKTPAS
jgi:NAD(P)-dependent dehydrogenase (short-subunit alcohol dehydrogenase family)